MGWTQHWFEREDLEGSRGTVDSVEAPVSKSQAVEVVVEVGVQAVLKQICGYLRDENRKAKVKKIKDSASDEIPTYYSKKCQGFSRIHNKKLRSTLTVPEVARTDGEEEYALTDCEEACGKTSTLTRVSGAGGGRLFRDLDLFPA